MNRLNLGCGSLVITGWTNVDYSIGAKISKIPVISFLTKKIGLFRTDWNQDIFIHDLRKQLPWGDDSIDQIYSSHTLEHLTRDDGEKLIHECFRVLKKGGVLRIVVPDLGAIIERYLHGDLLAEQFVEQLGVLNIDIEGRVKKILLPYVSFPHKCMYDKPSLLRIISQAGFNAELRAPFESLIGDIKSIEDKERTIDAVIVEGMKI